MKIIKLAKNPQINQLIADPDQDNCHIMNGSTFNQAFDNQSDRDSQMFMDAISLSSDRNSIAYSIYHSVQDLNQFNETDDGTTNQQNIRNDQKKWNRFLSDGNKTVDFVLAYNENDRVNPLKRQIFEKNLISEGLFLEADKSQSSVHFVKIYVPFEVTCRYAEIMKFKFPIKQTDDDTDFNQQEFELFRNIKSVFRRMFKCVRLNDKIFPKSTESELYHEFSRGQSYLFNIDQPDFFPNYVRLAVINFILERTKFTEDKDDNQNLVGIEKLLADGAYNSVYPLHDGSYKDKGTQRHLLYEEWASLKVWIKHQPLDNIKEYFGVKIALYFAWLGFYTHMLIPVSIVGLFCILYGIFSMFGDRVSNEICNSNKTIIMCPHCDENCDFWYLSETCSYSKVNHLLDNNFTVFFSIVMSIWATVYLELWKRYASAIVHRWGMIDFNSQSEFPRSAYLTKLKTTKRKTKMQFNVITKQVEPAVSFWKIVAPSYLLSYSIIILYIIISIAAVFALIIYRMSTITSRRIYGDAEYVVLLPITTGLINLIVITILNYFYNYLAVFLTDMEFKRTQTEYDDSLALKIYLFQFVNYYSSLFYIAFVKGKFPGYPHKYNRIFGLRQEECGPGGCLMELFIQLTIIMVGKQIINSILEIGYPYIMQAYKTMSSKKEHTTSTTAEPVGLKSTNQWTSDFKLSAWTSMSLFEEYLEMIIQFGFVTLFVVALPLAPVFALINNVFEMRLDAKKFLLYYRRSVPKRVSNIGVWYQIMVVLGKLSVITSAVIIAFSSSFIPKLIYMYSVNPLKNDEGYLDFTLAYFNTVDFENGTKPLKSEFEDVETCRYFEFRNPPGDGELKYKRPVHYWKILAARLAFIIIYQNIVSLVQTIVDWAIPDMPNKLNEQIKRENYMINNIIIREEKAKSILLKAEKELSELEHGYYDSRS